MSKTTLKPNQALVQSWRLMLMLAVLIIIFAIIVYRVIDLQVIQSDQLRLKGDARTLRVKQQSVQRGMIFDRHGTELAVSTPVQAIWVDPARIWKMTNKEDILSSQRWEALCHILGVPFEPFIEKLQARNSRRFMYLQRQVEPAVAKFVRKLKLPGVYLREETKRYYPTAEISAHLVGFTNIDGQGIEGVEQLYNQQLTGKAGQQTIRKNIHGRAIEFLDHQSTELPQDIQLSIDQKIQSITYQALKSGVASFDATSGSAVVVDVETGEILALVNSPSFNPNQRENLSASYYRNRAITDIFEPGSTLKPIAVLNALEFGSVRSDAIIDTSPGWVRVNGQRVSDLRNYGELSLKGIVQKSSNVGVTKLVNELPKQFVIEKFYDLGFGNFTGLGLAGESMGLFSERHRWSDFEIATLSFGYAIGVTTVQLARAYAALGNKGILKPLTLIKDQQGPGERILSPEHSRAVITMMESVVSEGGSGTRAKVAGYRVAGKTGTAIKAVPGGYGDDYVGIFAGVAPASQPRVAVVVMINNPAGDQYSGGEVAAPIFSQIVAQTMRILNIGPDDLPNQNLRLAKVEKAHHE